MSFDDWGIDPEKWAEALAKRVAPSDVDANGNFHPTHEEFVAFLTGWFRDCMRAVVRSEMMAHWKDDPVSAMQRQREDPEAWRK